MPLYPCQVDQSCVLRSKWLISGQQSSVYQQVDRPLVSRLKKKVLARTRELTGIPGSYAKQVYSHDSTDLQIVIEAAAAGGVSVFPGDPRLPATGNFPADLILNDERRSLVMKVLSQLIHPQPH